MSRCLLGRSDMAEARFDWANAHLAFTRIEDGGWRIIAAPSSTENRARSRDSETRQTRKEEQWIAMRRLGRHRRCVHVRRRGHVGMDRGTQAGICLPKDPRSRAGEDRHRLCVICDLANLFIARHWLLCA